MNAPPITRPTALRLLVNAGHMGKVKRVRPFPSAFAKFATSSMQQIWKIQKMANVQTI